MARDDSLSLPLRRLGEGKERMVCGMRGAGYSAKGTVESIQHLIRGMGERVRALRVAA
jgi:hypothetical protein